MKVLLSLSILFLLCTTDYSEVAKQEILEAEKDFAQMAMDTGIKEAFLAYADSEAVLMRNDSLIVGFDGIRNLMDMQNYDGVQLEWSPDFVDAAQSGDLGYTYGHYLYSYKDSVGNPKSVTGVFHTVWRKQPDGSWKYVWD